MRRGFSLLEVVVAGAIASVVMLLTVQFVIPALKLSQSNQHLTQMQQSAYTTLQSLGQDLQETNLAGLSYHAPTVVNNVTILVTHPLSPVLVQNRPVYQAKLVEYQLRTTPGPLQRRIWNPPPALTLQPDQARRLTQAEMLSLAAATGAWETRTLCREVYELSVVSSVAAPNWANPLRLRLGLRRGQDTYVMEQVRWLRNSP